MTFGKDFVNKVQKFVNLCYVGNGCYSYRKGGLPSLYATDYALMTGSYLGFSTQTFLESLVFIKSCQEPDGFFYGPEIIDWLPNSDSKHDVEHVKFHMLCTTYPVLLDNNIGLSYPLKCAHIFVNKDYLLAWLSKRNWQDAWLEGNNLLFVGQLLVYLRDYEHIDGASVALDTYFNWLEKWVDPETGLWGTNGYCSSFVAMCGGYHQLLVYFHEKRAISQPKKLVDTVLSLQHCDGGFSPTGGGGACEDVDAVDILVNSYKRLDYRRADIRVALRKTLRYILELQNQDGGFPYNRKVGFIHLGIPSTRCEVGESNMFSTWFRVHTLALISQILTDDAFLRSIDWGFNRSLSMGWHEKMNLGRLSICDLADERFIRSRTVFLKLIRKVKGWFIRNAGN